MNLQRIEKDKFKWIRTIICHFFIKQKIDLIKNSFRFDFEVKKEVSKKFFRFY